MSSGRRGTSRWLAAYRSTSCTPWARARRASASLKRTVRAATVARSRLPLKRGVTPRSGIRFATTTDVVSLGARRADALDRAVPESDVHHGGAPVSRKEPRAVVAAPCASGDEPCERQHRTSPGHRLASPTAAARTAAPRRPCGSHYQDHRLASRRASPSLRGRRSARTIRITDSPRGARRRASAAAARLALPGSQTRLAARVAEPPRPPLGSHYHTWRTL